MTEHQCPSTLMSNGGTCLNLSTLSLSLPLPITPLISYQCSLITPLYLFALSLLILSLLATQKLSKTPLREIGQVGFRGRKYFSWNESKSGAGGSFFDWWFYGGSVWFRFWFCLCDGFKALMGLEEGYDTGDDNHGENLFACFGVAHKSPKDHYLKEDNEDRESFVKAKEAKEKQHHNVITGILGYDSSLGAHGPLVLAPLRASILLLVWCSLVSFLVWAFDALIKVINDFNAESEDGLPESVLYVATRVLVGIQSILNIEKSELESSQDFHDALISTTLYATTFVFLLEISFCVIGGLASFSKIYVPKGVSHPGGPRPHKIVRKPQWTKGQQHVIPKELIRNGRWRCAVAHDAHRDTVAKFSIIGGSNIGEKKKNASQLLTGEPFGRQLWTLLERRNPSKKDGESIETEDDLERMLRREFSYSSSENDLSETKRMKPEERSSGLFSPIMNLLNPHDNEQLINGKHKQEQNLGEIIHSLWSPSSQSLDKEAPKSNSPKDQAIGELIQNLASGGRSPAFAFEPSRNPNSCDQIFRAQMIASYLENNSGKLPDEIAFLQQQIGTNESSVPATSNRPKTAMEAAKRGIAFYSILQTSDGHFAGDYGGPHFLLPGLVVAWYVMGCPTVMISPPQQALMLHYLKVHQQEDGGWGTHIESPSTMFGTVLCYLAVRLLGGKKDEEWIVKGREFIEKEGGAVMTSSWAKFWLCLIGCMEWEGHNSVPPEMWLLPNWFPFHPGRLWCHCRMVYLPMGYLYGSRFVYSEAESDPLISELREELYCDQYDTIDWDKTRHLVADMDNYSPIPSFMKFAQNCLSIYENWKILRPARNFVRKSGLRFCLEYMKAEDLQTNYIDIGPVNKALNMVSAFHAANHDINDQAVWRHMMRVPDYLWVAEDGMKMQGYNGSQCWDTSFAIQAVWECGMLDKFPILSSKVWAYLERTQILSTATSQTSPAFEYECCDSRDKFYRHVSKGGWPFSTSAHGWPISDCTGEGLKGVLALMDSQIITNAVERGVLKSIEPSRLYDAVNVILTLQNEDGGWATYENNRGFGWYEELNPSEVFGDIMVDYSYVECSMASLTALAEFHEKYPHHRTKEISLAIRRGGEFMKSIQREDGSWYGSWACCFCYGCWFGIEGLMKAGESASSPVIKKCCEFLLSHQRPNGGWGEDFTSCYDKDYAESGMQDYGDEGSGAVNTAWALMALSAAKCKDVDAIRRGVRYLMKRQLDSGDWPQEGISGVFNRACGITYTAYRNVFPIWALGRCATVYGDILDKE